jgi:2'-5' RNA ligase
MPATDRLFFALFPSAAAAAQIYSVQQDLRVRHGPWARPIAMTRLYVVLAHLGDYPSLPKDIEARTRDVASRIDSMPIEVTFDNVLSFAGRARNRPFVLQSKSGTEGVKAVQRQLGAAMKSCRLGRFARPYTPHMTLLCVTAGVTEQPIDPITWTATEFVLVHSLLGQTRHLGPGARRLDARQAESQALDLAS